MFQGSLTLTNYNGAVCLVNEIPGPGNYPVEEFIWHNSTRADSPPNLQAQGGHYHHAYLDPMSIEMRGHILSTDTSDYWVKRKALLAAVVPLPTDSGRYTGKISMQIDGDSSTYYANVILKDWDIPLQALYPTVTAFQIQWENPFGYWRTTAGATVLI
jgi:hypothetical protein